MRSYANRICPRIQESPAIRDTLYRSDRQHGVSKINDPELAKINDPERFQQSSTIFNDLGHVKDLLSQVLALKIL